MAAAAFIGCICTGHGCWPPRPGVSFSTDVKVNGLGAHRMGDLWMVHCCPDDGCHPGVVASGAGNVHINGRQAARMGDSVACGSLIAMGSPNVDFGAPMSAMSMISGALNLAGGLGIDIAVPSMSDVLGSVGVDVAGLDVTGWVSDNLFNGAVLPASVLSLTEAAQGFISNGSLLDLASFASKLGGGTTMPGALNLSPLNALAGAAGVALPQVVDKLGTLGIKVNSEAMLKGLNLGVNIVQNGLNVNAINNVGTILGFDQSRIGLPNFETIIKSYVPNIPDATLSTLTSTVDNLGANHPSLASVISDYTGLSTKVSNNIAGQLSNITVNYVESKLNSYVQLVPSSLGKRTVSQVMSQVKTKVTLDIQEKTGAVVFI